MTAVAEADGAKRRSGTALRPAAALTFIGLMLALAGAALIALTMGAAGIPLSRLPAALGLWTDSPPHPLAARDQLVLWSIRIPRIAAAAMVGGLRRHHAGAVSKSAGRSGAGRRFQRRCVRGGLRDRVHR
jgi:iron complex transport system permease protein